MIKININGQHIRTILDLDTFIYCPYITLMTSNIIVNGNIETQTLTIEYTTRYSL